MNPATAWGNVKGYVGTPGAGDAMATTLESIGVIQEGTLEVTNEAGDVLQLFEEGHILKDQLQLEGTLNVNFTLIGIPDSARKKFWDVEETGTGNAKKVSVKSLISNSKWSFKFAAEQVPGSETFEAPLCAVSMTPAYASTQGWTADVSMTILKGDTGKLFDFGIVPPTA